MAFTESDRLGKLPPYVFVQIDGLKKKAIAKGADIINFGIGDPDLPTARPIVAALARAAREPRNHQYPDGEGLPESREAICDYYARRFGVKLDPGREATTLIGSKEGIGHAPGAFINRGDTVAFPDPGYPVYQTGTIFNDGKEYRIHLNEENGYLPDLEKLPASVLSRIKILWVCYPHSPTAAVAPKSYLAKLVRLAKKHDFHICSDAAYVDIYFDGKKPPSILEVPGAKARCIEFYSCSKSFNMTGWRLAYAVGNRDMIAALRRYKNNLDSGQFNPVQIAGVEALRGAEKYIASNNRIYQRRRDLLLGGLRNLGWDVPTPEATFYVWMKTRHGMRSMEFFEALLKQCAIVTTPGFGLGSKSDGHIRLTLTVSEERIAEALRRIEKAGL